MRQYEKVVEYIMDLSSKGLLQAADQLPSIRTLSTQLEVSKASVIRGYEELESRHLIYVIPKSGYYWMDRLSDGHVKRMGIDFTKAHPDESMIPYRAFQHCINQAIELYQRELFSYSQSAGLPRLIHALNNHLAERQIFCRVGQIVVTSGSQQSLALLAQMDFDNDRRGVLVEQPSYSMFQNLTKLLKIPMAGIKRTPDSLDFKGLEKAFKSGQYKFFYCIPRCHNPYGTSLSEKDKKRLVSLAAKYKVYIVEDDYLADLSTDYKQLPLYYYDTAGMVIYIKSFSKAFLPGIRLGFAVLPKNLMTTFLEHKNAHDLNTSVLSQGALELFITSGLYDKHTQKAQKYYHQKGELAKHILSALTPLSTKGVHVTLPNSGFLCWIGFSQDYDLANLKQKLQKEGLRISDGSEFLQVSEEKPLGFRICFSTLTEEEITLGLTRLVSVIIEHSESTTVPAYL